MFLLVLILMPAQIQYHKLFWMLNAAGITGSVNGAYCFNEAVSYTLGLTVMDGNGCTSTNTPVNIKLPFAGW